MGAAILRHRAERLSGGDGLRGARSVATAASPFGARIAFA